jgi:hypothetical protein
MRACQVNRTFRPLPGQPLGTGLTLAPGSAGLAPSATFASTAPGSSSKGAGGGGAGGGAPATRGAGPSSVEASGGSVYSAGTSFREPSFMGGWVGGQSFSPAKGSLATGAPGGGGPGGGASAAHEASAAARAVKQGAQLYRSKLPAVHAIFRWAARPG